jgi:micrococcal nuclease
MELRTLLTGIKIMYHYKAKLVAWVDGDTCTVQVDLGFEIFAIKKVRVSGINCDEKNSTIPEKKQRSKEALAFANHLLPTGSKIEIWTTKEKKEYEKYGRWLATIKTPEDTDFATEMIRAGLADLYDGGQR